MVVANHLQHPGHVVDSLQMLQRDGRIGCHQFHKVLSEYVAVLGNGLQDDGRRHVEQARTQMEGLLVQVVVVWVHKDVQQLKHLLGIGVACLLLGPIRGEDRVMVHFRVLESVLQVVHQLQALGI